MKYEIYPEKPEESQEPEKSPKSEEIQKKFSFNIRAKGSA